MSSAISCFVRRGTTFPLSVISDTRNDPVYQICHPRTSFRSWSVDQILCDGSVEVHITRFGLQQYVAGIGRLGADNHGRTPIDGGVLDLGPIRGELFPTFVHGSISREDSQTVCLVW